MDKNISIAIVMSPGLEFEQELPMDRCISYVCGLHQEEGFSRRVVEQESTGADGAPVASVEGVIGGVRVGIGGEINNEPAAIALKWQRQTGESSRSASFAQTSETTLQRAEELLRTTDLPVREVVSLTGIRSVAKLNCLLQEKHGLTSGQYRLRTRADHWLHRIVQEDPPSGQLFAATGISSDAQFLKQCGIFEPRARARLHRFRLRCLMAEIDPDDPRELARILPPELLRLSITSLSLASRAANACRRVGILAVGDLLTRKAESLDRAPGLGKVSIHNLIVALRDVFAAHMSRLEEGSCELVERPTPWNQRGAAL